MTQLTTHNQPEMEPESNPLVSVIIATRDRPDVLKKCLTHLFEEKYTPFEVIIIDNSTNSDTQTGVEKFNIATYVKENPDKDNLSHLRNVGLRHSHGEICSFLDDDSLVQPGWMQAVVLAFNDPTVGGVGGRVIEDSHPEDYSPLIATLSPRTDMVCNFNNLWPEPVEIDYLYGCNMSWKRAALVKAGGFDTWMSYSRQDQELSLRVRKEGYKLIFQPGAEVEHLRATRAKNTVQRSGTLDFRSRFIHCRSLTYQYARHFGLSKDLLRLTFWQLPKGDAWLFFQSPSFKRVGSLLATVSGVVTGYCLSGLANLGLHAMPQVAKADPN